MKSNRRRLYVEKGRRLQQQEQYEQQKVAKAFNSKGSQVMNLHFQTIPTRQHRLEVKTVSRGHFFADSQTGVPMLNHVYAADSLNGSQHSLHRPKRLLRSFVQRHSLLAAYIAFGVTVSACLAAFAAFAVHDATALMVVR